MRRRQYRSTRQAALVKGYRSGLEVAIQEQLSNLGVTAEYESMKISYSVPVVNRTYTPDFKLPNGILIETKGRFVLEDRKKHLLIQSQYPTLDIRFVFQNSRNKIRKGSPTTYADWCIKHHFIYADKQIPASWLSE